MPLDTDALESGLLDLLHNQPAIVEDGDPDRGAMQQACASAWADAMRDYALDVVPESLDVESAASALETALETAFASDAAAPIMEAAFATFATAVAAGMGPAFVGAPPPAPVGFAALFADGAIDTHAEAAEAMADLIHDWMTTGTATPSAGGPTVNWT